MPDIPDITDLPDISDAPDAPDAPDARDTRDTPEARDTPDTPEIALRPAPDPMLGSPTEVDPAALAAASRPESGVADTARLLAAHFPALFGAGVIKPIKLRIQADIHLQAPGVFTKKALSMFLQRHTTATAYLRALVAEGATRIDLSGQPSGEIAAEHRDAAGLELERRRAIVDARKLAGREAARASRQDARPQQPPRSPLPFPQAVVAQPASQTTGERPAIRGAHPVRPPASDRPDRSRRQSRSGPGPVRSPAAEHSEPRGGGRAGPTGSGVQRNAHQSPPERSRVGAQKRESAVSSTSAVTPGEAAERDARHQRSMLLRSFEQSPLSKANFGALKGLSEATLDALLTQARQERG